MPLPAAAASCAPFAAAGCMAALAGGVVIVTAEASEGAAASLHAIALLSSRMDDNARERDESEGVSWIIGLLGWSRTVPRPI